MLGFSILFRSLWGLNFYYVQISVIVLHHNSFRYISCSPIRANAAELCAHAVEFVHILFSAFFFFGIARSFEHRCVWFSSLNLLAYVIYFCRQTPLLVTVFDSGREQNHFTLSTFFYCVCFMRGVDWMLGAGVTEGIHSRLFSLVLLLCWYISSSFWVTGIFDKRRGSGGN